MTKSKRFLSVLLAVLMFVSVVPMSDIGIEAEAVSTLTQLRNKYPHGKYWNHANNPGSSNSVNNQDGYTSTPCSKHGGYIGTSQQTCNGFAPSGTQLSWQCMGYAEKLGYDASGYNPRNNANGWTTYTNSSALDNLKPGDIVRYKNDGHSIYVIAVNGDTVTYTDCNSDGHCIIRWDATISKSTLKSSFTHVRSISTPKPSKPVLSISDKNTSDKDVTFTWNKTSNTSYYDLRIYNHGNYNTGAPYVKFGIGASTTSTTMRFPAGKYAAYITAVSPSGAETASDWITVFDVVDPPGKCTLTATVGKMVTDGVTFNWTKGANAHTYDLRVYHYGDYNVGAPYYEFGMSASTTSTTMKLPVGKYSAYITTIASNGAYEGGDSPWIHFTVSEPSINSSYPTNIKGYKMWIGATATLAFDTTTLNGYYLDDNEITIVSIFTNDWAKIKHTANGAEKMAYVPLGGLICDKVQPTKMYLKNSADIYSRYTCESKQSSQPKDKEVTVIGYYKTDLAQICYTINSTNYIGWILKENLNIHSSTNHNYTSKVTTQPTCTKTGVKTYTCTCGASYTEVISKASHNSNTTIPAVAATCTKTGLTEGKKCSVCGTITVTQQTVAKLAHSYTSTITTAATCKSTGLKTYKCKNCTASYTEASSKNPGNHTGGTEVKHVKAATCSTEGYTGDTYCKGCGVKTKSGTSTPKTSHNYTVEVLKQPTCTEKGVNYYTCSCGNSYVEYTDETEHTYQSDGICTECGDYNKSYDKENSDPSSDCTCNCHKSGFAGLIWKILNFFYKLFKINPVCECGIEHY